MGVTPALNALGIAYFNGLGVARDTQRAVRYLRDAADKGDPDAMTNLAAAILGGVVSGNVNRLSQPDFSEAIALLESSALRGRQGALLELGSILVESPRTFIVPPHTGTSHEGARDCPRGVAILRLLVEMWGPCARALADALLAHKAGAARQALMRYLHAATLGSSVGMANAAHLLLQLDDQHEASAALPRAGGRVALAHELLREAHTLGNTDGSLALADALHDQASAGDDGDAAKSHDSGFREAFTLYQHGALCPAAPNLRS
eukprot:634833-Prymnesium_polylepis.2